MKKVILSLVIGGLSISGDCFAANNSFDNGSKQDAGVAFREVKSDSAWNKVKSNTKKVLGNKKVQVAAIGTATVIGAAGAAVAAYYYSPSFAGFVNSNAKVIANYGKDASKMIANYRSNASKSINSFLEINPASTKWGKVLNSVKSYLGGKPAPTKWEKFVGGVKGYAGSAWNYAQPYANKGLSYVKSTWNSTPTWAKWTAAGVASTTAAGAGAGVYYYINTLAAAADAAWIKTIPAAPSWTDSVRLCL